ncbi:MAG: ribonuclease III [Pseudomonadota bacterium]
MKNSPSSSDEDLQRLEQRIGYAFRDRSLLQQALTHRSAARTNASAHNERLEFLGDAVLGHCVAEHLFRALPTAAESEMTLKRASLVRRETLAESARQIDLGPVLRLGGGERRNGVDRQDSVLSDALEALIGAVYLDSDLVEARALVLRLLSDHLQALANLQTKDAKTLLQEFMQGQGLALPRYEVVGTAGALHEQTFHVACVLDALSQRGEGTGSSRREAEKAAAAQLLERLDV